MVIVYNPFNVEFHLLVFCSQYLNLCSSGCAPPSWMVPLVGLCVQSWLQSVIMESAG